MSKSSSPQTDRTQPARLKNFRTRGFYKQFKELPKHAQDLARGAFKAFALNPYDPALENEDLYDSRRGRHEKGSRSVAVSRSIRAIYVVVTNKNGTANCWYWIGTHEAYNKFVGSRRG